MTVILGRSGESPSVADLEGLGKRERPNSLNLNYRKAFMIIIVGEVRC